MGKLARLPAKKVIQKLKRAGFVESHQRGSHVYLENKTTGRIVSVAVHGGSKEIPIGTLYNIVVKQAGLDPDEFNRL